VSNTVTCTHDLQLENNALLHTQTQLFMVMVTTFLAIVEFNDSMVASEMDNFSQLFQENARIILQSRSRAFPFTSFFQGINQELFEYLTLLAVGCGVIKKIN